ncbi:P-loop containing nucleoside triphosphate hydrolase [Syntrophomonas zehnderi OL-4]|uniref:DNA 3'-5' helicase n=1 Tax=Syntrophomonas zehnderi OL-4 TaxID=690567 RepID=A0A0E4GD86_9FIRM|nr:UvrD-helicase domain-containing protein [Syntrophomonas zehnderi]CFY01901.1 P-loop containing nucleoside triphosphate hydrolase [Syntrophomonas zehnderi OL-4]
MTYILEGLNEQQKQAILHIDGPCMVLAGAGSGKTRVLTSRIGYLIENGIAPDSILAITFTNKAAQEMRTRVGQMQPDYQGRWIQTFHAACYKILRMDIHHLGYERSFAIIDDTEGKTLIKEILKEEHDYETKPEEVLYSIKQAKNSLLNPEKYFQNLSLPLHIKDKYYRVFRSYNARLKEYNALDFEDLIILCIKLFRDYPEVLEKYQHWFRYIMIDEYQDTNYAQYIWANLLAARHRNIFVVGDPDQSVYSWRGAEPYNVKKFLKDYPDAQLIKLEKNYRSSQYILQAANAVIKNNSDREEKNLYTDNPRGDKIIYYCAGDSFQEGRFVAGTIADLIDREGKRYSDCAIFYRTHAQSRIVEEALLHRYIPYQIIGARKFYERKEIKDILAYLKLICNPNDRLSFKRVINVPRRGIGDKTLEKLEDYADQQGIMIMDVLADATVVEGISKKMAATLEDFYGMITFLQDLNKSQVPVQDILHQLMEMSGYIEDINKNNPADAQTRIENLQELRSLAIEYTQEGIEGLDDFLARVALVQDTDDLDYADAVMMMTYHGAKGLEFPIVFMTGMEEGVFPSYRTETPEDMEEERRLCYVGITRACERLYLTNAVSRLLYGYERNNPPSRFIKEIPADLLTPPLVKKMVSSILNEGDTVVHKKFGMGVVISIEDDEIAVVDFERAGTRTLRLDIAPLEKIS